MNTGVQELPWKAIERKATRYEKMMMLMIGFLRAANDTHKHTDTATAIPINLEHLVGGFTSPVVCILDLFEDFLNHFLSTDNFTDGGGAAEKGLCTGAQHGRAASGLAGAFLRLLVSIYFRPKTSRRTEVHECNFSRAAG